MSTFKQFSEAPIDTFQKIGNFDKGSSFRSKTDRAILSSDKAVQKIKNKWANSKHKYDMYFLNSKEAKEHGEKGVVSPEFVANTLNIKDFKNNPDAITIIFTGNSGDERVQLTPWILAHRFGHAIWYSWKEKSNPEHSKINEAWTRLIGLIAENVNPIFENGYEFRMNIQRSGDGAGMPNFGYGDRNEYDKKNKVLGSFYESVGTMKSARDKELRGAYEFYYELLAQYIFANEIKFRPIPKSIPYGKAAWGKQDEIRFRGAEGDYEYYDGMMQNIVDEYPAYADYLLNRCVGKIMVM
jgi:hypothetical protein